MISLPINSKSKYSFFFFQIGDPNDDPSKDHHGKPEGSKSKVREGSN